MFLENDEKSVGLLYHLVTAHTKAVHESVICEDWWKKHKEGIYFPKPEYVHKEWDGQDKRFFFQKAKSMLGTNRSLDFFMYILTDYEKETDFILTLRRQEMWLIGFLVSGSSWKLEARESWFPRIGIHLVELTKSDNRSLFHYWENNYSNVFTNLSEIRKAKNNG